MFCGSGKEVGEDLSLTSASSPCGPPKTRQLVRGGFFLFFYFLQHDRLWQVLASGIFFDCFLSLDVGEGRRAKK